MRVVSLALVLAAGALAARAQSPVPLVLVHGMDGSPDEPAILARALARGRPVLDELYAADAEALAPGSLAKDAIVCFGYYREARGAPRFYADRAPQLLASIGGCPVPRSDPRAASYGISYAAQLERAIEGICRATGSDQVDLVGFSLGGIVSRAYTRWRSLRGPNGASRVRRVMTVCSPNHGVNVIEASVYAWTTLHGLRAHAIHGELAEVDADCRRWNGRGYLEHLNDGWDAFCRAQGIVYASAAAHGESWQHANRGLVPFLAFLLGWLGPPILVHEVNGLDVARAFAEAAEDGDGAIRLRSAQLDPARYSGVLFNALFRGVHSDAASLDHAPMAGVYAEALVRRFALERRSAPGFSAAAASARVIDAGDEGSWLLLEADLRGTPLAATVHVKDGFGPFERQRRHGLLLREGAQRLALDLDWEGNATIQVDLFGIDGHHALPPISTRCRRGRGPAPRPVPLLGGPVAAPGAILFPVSVAGHAPHEVALGIDDGVGPRWTGWLPGVTGLTLSLPPPGRYEVLLRGRAAPNAAGEQVEVDRPDALRLIVEPNGSWSIRR